MPCIFGCWGAKKAGIEIHEVKVAVASERQTSSDADEGDISSAEGAVQLSLKFTVSYRDACRVLGSLFGYHKNAKAIRAEGFLDKIGVKDIYLLTSNAGDTNTRVIENIDGFRALIACQSRAARQQQLATDYILWIERKLKKYKVPDSLVKVIYPDDWKKTFRTTFVTTLETADMDKIRDLFAETIFCVYDLGLHLIKFIQDESLPQLLEYVAPVQTADDRKNNRQVGDAQRNLKAIIRRLKKFFPAAYEAADASNVDHLNALYKYVRSIEGEGVQAKVYDMAFADESRTFVI